MNVALVGATGNIGSRVLAELLSRGHSVTAIARNPEKLPANPKTKPLPAMRTIRTRLRRC